MGGPASSYATAGIALRVTESHKPPPHHYKVETPSGQRSLRGPYWNFVYCTGDHDKWRYTISTCRSRLVIQPPKIYISSDTVTVLLFHSAPNPQNPLSYELTFFPTQPLNLYSIFARRTSGVETFKMFCVQDMKVYRGRRGIDPPTLKFSTTWRCMVNFRTPPPPGTQTLYPLNRRLNGPHSRPGHLNRTEKYYHPTGIRSPNHRAHDLLVELVTEPQNFLLVFSCDKCSLLFCPFISLLYFLFPFAFFILSFPLQPSFHKQRVSQFPHCSGFRYGVCQQRSGSVA